MSEQVKKEDREVKVEPVKYDKPLISDYEPPTVAFTSMWDKENIDPN